MFQSGEGKERELGEFHKIFYSQCEPNTQQNIKEGIIYKCNRIRKKEGELKRSVTMGRMKILR